MSGTYTWPQVVNGKPFTQADFDPYGYAKALPDLLGNFAAQAASAQGAVQAANAQASAAAAATSAAQAAARVAGVTAGSTANLVYPEAVASLVTATDVRDVLIYDTRLDSDGGAWRMQCQHTSWFNEALNTATRGAKRDFPAVALIVLRDGSVTIYDLHDLSGSVPRMWMVFSGVLNNMYQSLASCLAAQNGRLFIGASNVITSGFYELDFASDAARVRNGATTSAFFGRIASRNSGSTYAGIIAGSAVLASSIVTDISTRVLPGALRDNAGLPIPTVAVATTGGISVIHPSGQIASLTGNFGRVCFVSDTHISGLLGSDAGAVTYYAIPYATAAETGQRIAVYYSGSTGNLNYAVGPQVTITPQASGAVGGLANFAHDWANPATGMVAVAARSHATGWQPSDIRLSTLCDGQTGAWASDIRISLDGTSVAGFTSANSGTVTTTGGRIRVARNGVNDPGGQVIISGLTVGETYTIDFDAYIGTAGAWSVVLPTISVASAGGVADAVGRRLQFVADQTTGTLSLYAITSTGTQFAEFDNITIRAGVADRSYRAYGMHVIGNISRAAVGTGNDVVAYSGFTSSNYLEQPYSSLFDFGNGGLAVNFSVTFWGRASSGTGYYVERDSVTTGARFSLFASSNKISFSVSDGTNSASLVSATDFVNAGFALWHFVRRGSTMEIWRNGVLDASGTGASVGSLTNGGARLRVGERVSASSPGTGLAISMLRIAAYAPTPMQIGRMFSDESPLFDSGAKAFIGGTSGAVNDLSFSEQSRRLAVATTDGVSVFSGLRRVEYLNTGNLSPAMAANNTAKIALEAGALMVSTTANAGVRREAVTGLDRMQAAPSAPFSPRRITARGVTTDATPLALAPRLHIGERETLIVEATIVGRVFGAADGQRIGYQRRATYYRDAGGNVTLQGSVQTIGTDTEVSGVADATLLIDTTAQTVTPQVTGVASERIFWTATLQVTRIADAQYEEIV